MAPKNFLNLKNGAPFFLAPKKLHATKVSTSLNGISSLSKSRYMNISRRMSFEVNPSENRKISEN